MTTISHLLTPKPYRWPRKNDLPFRKAKNARSEAPISHDRVTRKVSIIGGFMLAGNALADQALNEAIQRHDLVYPMLFCYRHAIETGLKWLVEQYGPPLDVVPGRLDDTHDLLFLWNNCVRLFQACGPNVDDEATTVVGGIVKQFHEWDKCGIAFRYATNKSGAVKAFQYPSIDIPNLRDVMEGFANFISGSDGWLDNITRA